MTNSTKKATKKMCYQTLDSMLDVAESTGITLEDVTYADLHDFIANELTLLANKAQSARERAAAKKVEGDELREKIYSVLSAEDFMVIPDILEALDIPNLTAQSVTSRLNALVNAGRAIKDKVTVPAVDGKTRKIVGYKAVEA